ncbi:thymidine kinase [uncultured Subdoligranulum sp.]|uniref:thymidine kinase n=1 Tax=uncultured Subdoligranulum sp. TaxID=512298 RepID=UPI0025D737FC|nr:thymidine kinase [uncultured Subdoligranulum sp.]
MAKLYFRYGAMNSGKTTALLQVAFNYKERGMRVLILKASIDTKGGDTIVSRLGVSCKVDYLVSPETDILELVRDHCRRQWQPACILCDESQFFTPEQAEQLFLVTVDLGIPVICYGLRADFMMRGFPGSTRLLELAHSIEEMKTICACGRKAMCNGRKVNGQFVFEGAQVAIDMVDHVEYESLCPQCWYREYRAFRKRQQQKAP